MSLLTALAGSSWKSAAETFGGFSLVLLMNIKHNKIILQGNCIVSLEKTKQYVGSLTFCGL